MTHASEIPVLYFHSVAPSPNLNWYKSKLTISVQFFERLLKYYSSHNYSFLSLDEYSELNRNPRIDRKSICLTFDDGYLDNYVYVFPLLKRYNAKATIFISPEFVNPEETVHLTMDDFWDGQCLDSDLKSSGFLSWAEMRIMENSGLVDIESHTMTHTKIINDSTIIDFHHSGADWLYPISNLFKERKPFYINDDTFEHLLPYGTPFFTESSALVTKQVSINPSFCNECVDALDELNWDNYDFAECTTTIESILGRYSRTHSLVENIESSSDYEKRIRYEIFNSKSLIQRKLNKEVKYLCWPHGDYNQLCIDIAFEAGYSSVHAVSGKGPIPDRSFTRIGVAESNKGSRLSSLRTICKTGAMLGLFPYKTIDTIYRKLHGMF